jgi:predicted nucleotide-binding protein (sugar kinase/HSP70/actin superfamily)
LFNAFFKELGFNVKLSDANNKKIIRTGMESVVAEPCFLSRFHMVTQLNWLNRVLISFSYRGHAMEKPCGTFETAVTCPYLQSGPDVIRAALELDKTDVKLISPVLHFERGHRHIERRMIQVGKELGKSTGRNRKELLKSHLRILKISAQKSGNGEKKSSKA